METEKEIRARYENIECREFGGQYIEFPEWAEAWLMMDTFSRYLMFPEGGEETILRLRLRSSRFFRIDLQVLAF